jgi:hypothetical protein
VDIAIGGPWGTVAANATTILRLYIESMTPEMRAEKAKDVADALSKVMNFLEAIKDRIHD